MFDFYIQLLWGIYYSLALGLKAVLLCLPVSIVGAILLRKKTFFSRLILYGIDVFVALPHQILLISLAGILGGSPHALLLSVFVTQVPGILKHFRVHLLRAYDSPHVEAARALGVPAVLIFWKHILPRLWVPLSLSATSLIKRVILIESLVTFLGLGFDPLTPSLGRLISEGRGALFLNPAYFLAPVMTLILCLIVLQSFSDRFSSLFRSRGIRYL